MTLTIRIDDATDGDWTGGLVGDPRQRLTDPREPKVVPEALIRRLDPTWGLSGSFPDRRGKHAGE